MNAANPNNDLLVQQSPSDTVSCLSFSPVSNMLCAGGWSRDCSIWEVASNGQTIPKAKISSTAPILCAQWSNDGQRIFTAGCDNQVKMWNLATNQTVQIGQHANPIKHCHWIAELNLVVTGSWDKTLKYWDCRQPTPTASVQLNERVYAMDVSHPVVVVATAEKKNNLVIFDLTKPTVPYRQYDSPLKFQSRCLSIFPDKTGFAVGSIEGRVAISHVHERDSSKNFAFKCHREGSEVYSVNSIAFHHYGTFATAGADGVYTYWDKDAKQRLKLFSRVGNPITASTFNRDGTIYAYAVGYDWSKGFEYAEKMKQPNAIYLHAVQDAEIARKKR